MPTKEEIKKEIDKMPDDLVNTVYQYIKEKQKIEISKHTVLKVNMTI